MSDERDPGDEQPESHADLLAALRHRDMVLRALPVDEDAERMADRMIARNRPTGEQRRKLEPRAAALRDIDSTWRRTGRR